MSRCSFSLSLSWSDLIICIFRNMQLCYVLNYYHHKLILTFAYFSCFIFLIFCCCCCCICLCMWKWHVCRKRHNIYAKDSKWNREKQKQTNNLMANQIILNWRLDTNESNGKLYRKENNTHRRNIISFSLSYSYFLRV